MLLLNCRRVMLQFITGEIGDRIGRPFMDLVEQFSRLWRFSFANREGNHDFMDRIKGDPNPGISQLALEEFKLGEMFLLFLKNSRVHPDGIPLRDTSEGRGLPFGGNDPQTRE